MNRIGLTAGDPAGIGLEVLLRALPRFVTRGQWLLFGNQADFEAARERYQPTLEWRRFLSYEELDSTSASGLWLHPTSENSPAVIAGQGSPESGQRALEALTLAADHAQSGALDGIVTAPLNKRLVGTDFTGQTEFLRDSSAMPQVAMSFFTPTFKVVLATTHLSLRAALDRLSVKLYEELLTLIDHEFSRLGYPRPRVGVAGINPHAGEHGMFGSDEDEILRPAVEWAVDRGLDVSGPWSPDTCYQRAHGGEFDIVLAPYHDQGLIPVKLIAPGASANVTLGLPYIRTSPDHGTAFEIAGQGVARIDGMESAIQWAMDLVDRQKESRAAEA